MGDYWISGSFRFGCKHKDSNHKCDQSYLTFLAKLEGDFTGNCKPNMSLSGGGWPRKGSNVITMEDSYVDAGHLSTNEWRRVLIPLDDLETTEWDLKEVYAITFHRCGNNLRRTEHKSASASYHISSLAVTNNAIELVSLAPSSAPSVYVTDDPSLVG